MKRIALIFAFLAATLSVSAQAQKVAQNNPNSQEVVVRVVNEQPKPQAAEKPVVDKANEWVDFGKNVGSAMDAGLASLTDHAEKFSKTDAGRFTMAIIAWKVAGKDALQVTQYVTDKAVHILFGIPALIAWNILCIWFFRRMFLPRRVVLTREGPFWARKKTWAVINQDEEWSDGKTSSAYVTCAAWIIVSLVLLFQVIL